MDNVLVNGISDGLVPCSNDDHSSREVFILSTNAGICYEGSVTLGTGFLVPPELAEKWITIDERNRDVLFPYIGGREFNDSPTFTPPRWAIRFRERPIEEAMTYSLPFQHIREHVYPERMTKDGLKYPRMVQEWWKYWHERHVLYEAASKLDRVLIRSRVCSRHMIGFVPATWVYSDAVTVFALNTFEAFAELQSTLHEVWMLENSSTMRTDLRYIQSSCFETFPRPTTGKSHCNTSGKDFYMFRSNLMVDRQEGLTKTYGHFHDSGDMSSDIKRLRQLHVEMDNAVAAAYGWMDIDLSHGFHESKQGTRFTISETGRREVVARLLALNRHRHSEENAHGLHEAKKRKRERKKSQSKDNGDSLFRA